MKTLKQARAVLFVVLAAISILPGCGKSNNNNGGIAGGAVYGLTNATISNNGQCYNLNTGYGGQQATLIFGGAGYLDSAGWLKGQVGPANTGMPGVMYTRTNQAGDSVSAYVSGSTLYAVATLAPSTVAWIQQYLGGQICGLYFNTPTSGSTLTMSTMIVMANGQVLASSYLSL